MTKINKLGKSTFVIAILSFILVAVLAFGGTYAYFSDVSGRAAGQVTTGHLTLNATGDAVNQINGYTIASKKIVKPGQPLVEDTTTPGKGAAVTATVNTNIDYYIRVKFNVEVTPKTPDAQHDGEIVRDDKLTTADETRKETEGEGDYVADHVSILDISLKVQKGAETLTPWTEYTTEEGANGHTGYFYPGYTAQAYDDETNASVAVDDIYNMEVLVNIHDWVGAYGCTYYMDAAIEIYFEVEVLQAEYLDASKLDNKFDGTIDSLKELHDTWDLAVNYAQGAPKDLGD